MLALPVFKVQRDCKAPQGLLALPVRVAYKVCRVLKVCKVPKVWWDQQDRKVYRVHKVSTDLLVQPVFVALLV
jgi:hypothetical protein